MTPDICFLVFLHVHHVHQNIATHTWSCMTMVIVIPWSLKFIFSPEKARSVVVSRAKQGEISMPHIQDYQDLKDPNHDLVHSVSLGSNPPLVNHTPAIFFVPPGTEKLNESPPGRQKALIILICCTCLTIKLILISEQPTKTYFLVMLFKWCNRTKMSQN